MTEIAAGKKSHEGFDLNWRFLIPARIKICQIRYFSCRQKFSFTEYAT